jgi:DNA replication protein DnaC
VRQPAQFGRPGPGPLTAEQRRDLLEIVEDRYNRGSLIITSQVPVDRWYEIVGNPTLADAILDRLVHNSHRSVLTGKSRRKPETPTAEPEHPTALSRPQHSVT